MKTHRRSVVSCLGLLIFMTATAAQVRAAKESYNVDSVHSNVVFCITHAGVSPFYGMFKAPEGSFVVDTDNPTNSSFHVKVKLANLLTGNGNRDGHLKSDDYFSADKFPTITFTSKSIKKTGKDKHYEMTGTVKLLGKEKDVIVALEHTGKGQMRGHQKIGFHATFTIKTSDFGMTSQGLGDEVKIMAGLQGNLKKGQAAEKIQAEHVALKLKQQQQKQQIKKTETAAAKAEKSDQAA